MRVRWGDCIFSPFRVSNGVRQGGILSPYLFNVYMDDLSCLLNCCNTGCVSGDTIINHLMYADDLVLISPSATGMKELLCACEVYSLEHAIIYNSKKSTVVVCIGVNRPAFGGTVPHFHQMSREMRQMSRIFRKLHYHFFRCRLFYMFAL